MTVNLLTEHHLEFLNLKEAAQTHLSLHLSKYHMSRLIDVLFVASFYGFFMHLQVRTHMPSSHAA